MVAPEVPTTIRVRVPAKINLALCVGPVADDGYHPLTTVFQAVSLHDELTAHWDEPGQFSVAMTGEGMDLVAADRSNLAIRAAELIAERHGADRYGVRLSIRKSIPVAGGMAGGSADAAAALLACSVLWDLDIDPAELREYGADLGADVPFALLGGTAIGTGRGDKLVPVLSRGSHHWVLAMAETGLSTPKVFGRFDELTPEGFSLDMPTELINALATGDSVELGKHLRNDLAEAAIDLQPSLQTTMDVGMECGALGAIISGSGPTVAFLCRNEESAVSVSATLGGEGVARAVRRVAGPVVGARLITPCA